MGDRRSEESLRKGVKLLARAHPEWDDERYVNDFSLGSTLVHARGSAFIDGNTSRSIERFDETTARYVASPRTRPIPQSLSSCRRFLPIGSGSSPRTRGSGAG